MDKDALAKKINSKIFYGDVKDTVDDFVKTKPNQISCIFLDLDLYTSTINFLNQIPKIDQYLLPRVLCYFDDVYVPENYISHFNGVFKAIDEFNEKFKQYKFLLSCTVTVDKFTSEPVPQIIIRDIMKID